MVKNIFQNIFSNFLKKYFQKIFSIPKCYIPFWNRETKCHHMALIEIWFEEFFFQHLKGGPFGFTKNICNTQVLYHFGIVRPNAITWHLDLQKQFLQCRGVILHEKKFCKTRSSSNMSKNALLSAFGWNPKLHNYHPPLYKFNSSRVYLILNLQNAAWGQSGCCCEKGNNKISK